MKKLLAILLALVVVGGAFAQATVNGYVRTIGTYTNDTESFTLAERLRLTLGYTSEDKNVTFGARLENNDWTQGGLSVKYAYGKIALANGMVVVSGGKLWNYDYDLSSGLSDYFVGNVANGAGYGLFAATDGMILQVKPVEGLSFGLLANPDGGLAYDQLALAASYTIAGIGDIVLSDAFVNDMAKSAVSASFKYTGVEGLGVAVGYKGLDTTGIYTIVDYETGDIAAQLAGDYNVDNETMYVETSVTYTMGAFSFLGAFGYDKTGTFALGEAGKESKYFVGAELRYNVGNGQIAINPNIDDYAGFSLPIVVKVKF